MPLAKGSSKNVIAENFHEFRHGKTFARTERKFGKATADKQLVAVVLGNARRSIADVHSHMKKKSS